MRGTWTTFVGITCLAGLVHAAALAGVWKLRGEVTAYAFASPDAAEYVALARGLAGEGAFVPVDADGHVTGDADTWRTPGFPLALAPVVAVFGGSEFALVLYQQVLAVLTVPAFWLCVRRYAPPRWALAATLLWALDPFRVYYSLWIMAETLFTLMLLAGAGCWLAAGKDGWTPRRALLIGLLAGAMVLVRPIGLPLPVLAVLGLAVIGWRLERWGGWRYPLAAMIGAVLVIMPWMIRNQAVSGHFALSHQAGASVAYHKAVDVLLWSRGQSELRFDPASQARMREEFIDSRLQQRWTERYGEPDARQREDLTWRRLNYGASRAIDPFQASSLLAEIGVEVLRERWPSTLGCFLVQGGAMLAFPLGLVIAPPAGEGAAPLSTLLGSLGSGMRTGVAIGLGGAYGLLALAAVAGLAREVIRRRWVPAMLAFWPAAAMWALTLPFEDPRFRLPLVPLMWLMALPRIRVPGEEVAAVSTGDREADLPDSPFVRPGWPFDH